MVTAVVDKSINWQVPSVDDSEIGKEATKIIPK